LSTTTDDLSSLPIAVGSSERSGGRDMSEWEPSEASIEAMLRATAEEQGFNFDEIALGEVEDARRVAPIAIKAAVAADPLLSAAKDMQEALSEVREWIKEWDPNFTYDEEWPATRAKIDAALSKSRGQQ
jgi:DNA-binding phage protein